NRLGADHGDRLLLAAGRQDGSRLATFDHLELARGLNSVSRQGIGHGVSRIKVGRQGFGETIPAPYHSAAVFDSREPQTDGNRTHYLRIPCSSAGIRPYLHNTKF